MRVLLTTQPGEGHWRPLATLGMVLLDTGHEVAFATTPIFCEIVQRFGFSAFTVGVDDWRDTPAPRVADASPAQAGSALLEQFIPRASRNLPEMLDLCRGWKPDLIVREQTEFAGYLAAEILGLPHAALQVSVYRPHLERSAATALNHLREANDLAADLELISLYRHLFLMTFPPTYLDPRIPLPPTARALSLNSFDLDEPDADLPAWIEGISRRPLVYATLGTAYNRTSGLFDAILQALRDEPLSLILTTTNFDVADFPPQPANVYIQRYVPQSLLLPHCDLVLTHGGSGTVRAALSQGLPLVIIPIAADQPDNARRCASLGLAEVVDADQRTPQMIRAAVRRVLDDPGYRQRAQAMQREIEQLPRVEEAVGWLERLVRPT